MEPFCKMYIDTYIFDEYSLLQYTIYTSYITCIDREFITQGTRSLYFELPYPGIRLCCLTTSSSGPRCLYFAHRPLRPIVGTWQDGRPSRYTGCCWIFVFTIIIIIILPLISFLFFSLCTYVFFYFPLTLAILYRREYI